MTNRFLFGTILGVLLFCFCARAADDKEKDSKKEELCFQVQLIWGVTEKQNDPKLSPVSAELTERLKQVFKWNHYYQVSSSRVCVPAGGSKKHKLSDKCDVEIKDLGKRMLEVKLFGEGQLVRKVTHAVVPTDLVLAGDEPKNKTAWFVVLSPKAK